MPKSDALRLEFWLAAFYLAQRGRTVTTPSLTLIEVAQF